MWEEIFIYYINNFVLIKYVSFLKLMVFVCVFIINVLKFEVNVLFKCNCWIKKFYFFVLNFMF